MVRKYPHFLYYFYVLPNVLKNIENLFTLHLTKYQVDPICSQKHKKPHSILNMEEIRMFYRKNVFIH